MSRKLASQDPRQPGWCQRGSTPHLVVLLFVLIVGLFLFGTNRAHKRRRRRWRGHSLLEEKPSPIQRQAVPGTSRLHIGRLHQEQPAPRRDRFPQLRASRDRGALFGGHSAAHLHTATPRGAESSLSTQRQRVVLGRLVDSRLLEFCSQ